MSHTYLIDLYGLIDQRLGEVERDSPGYVHWNRCSISEGSFRSPYRV